jgi:hypothetical protein
MARNDPLSLCDGVQNEVPTSFGASLKHLKGMAGRDFEDSGLCGKHPNKPTSHTVMGSSFRGQPGRTDCQVVTAARDHLIVRFIDLGLVGYNQTISGRMLNTIYTLKVPCLGWGSRLQDHAGQGCHGFLKGSMSERAK